MKIYKYFLLKNKKLKSWVKYWLYLKSKVIKIINLFVFPEAGTTQGITYSINNDGTINLSGRTSSSSIAKFIIFKDLEETGIINGETYTLSSDQQFPLKLEVRVECFNGETWVRHLLGSVLNRQNQTITGVANTTNTTRIRYMIYVDTNARLDIQNLKLELVKG